TYRTKQTDIVGADKPMLLIIPAGVAHAYKNVGTESGIVFNCPNRLYKGPGRKEAVDEVRHEEDKSNPIPLDWFLKVKTASQQSLQSRGRRRRGSADWCDPQFPDRPGRPADAAAWRRRRPERPVSRRGKPRADRRRRRLVRRECHRRRAPPIARQPSD